jgi:hypothetical protein
VFVVPRERHSRKEIAQNTGMGMLVRTATNAKMSRAINVDSRIDRSRHRFSAAADSNHTR